MTFKEYTYQRPDPDQLLQDMAALIESFEAAADGTAQLAVLDQLYSLINQVSTQGTLAHIRHEIDTTDPFYDAENSFYDTFSPQVEAQVFRLNKALITSPFRQELEAELGAQVFRLAECQIASFKPEIVEDLAEENKLVSRYVKLTASAQIDFDGKCLTLAQLDPYLQSPDRAVRKAALEAKFGFFEKHEHKFEEIYSRLVLVRDRMAHKMGFKNFIPLGYLRLNRTDYQAADVARFREQVLRDLVPLCSELRARQRARLGLDALHFHDETFAYQSGNAKPKGDADWILARGQRMYEEMSPETAEFFQFMVEHELMDLLAKPGKAGGGFCTILPDYRAPFIFSNFNGTAGDIEVLTHEAGHAFQMFRSRNFRVPNYYMPTLEACEIHSMSMEFLTWPWMSLFFEDETDKFKFTHLAEALLFIPYGVAVDEFQHFVYEHPTLPAAERKAKWREIEQKYLPSRSYDGVPLLERGGLWIRQSHIFQTPFYYIDYTLAQTCALQFWARGQDNPAAALQDYIGLCDLGGSQPFTKLVEAANLENPFVDGTLRRAIPAISTWLNQIDDTAF